MCDVWDMCGEGGMMGVETGASSGTGDSAGAEPLLEHCSLRLAPHHVPFLRELGHGNLSLGVRLVVERAMQARKWGRQGAEARARNRAEQ